MAARLALAQYETVTRPDSDEQMRRNQDAWDLRTAAHLDSDFYDVASFKAGRLSLRAPEREELGDVSGRTLLHLMCHFGMDQLQEAGWSPRSARRGSGSSACASCRSTRPAEGAGRDSDPVS